MTSSLSDAGSTREWREVIRPLVFAEYGRECLMIRDGSLCKLPATTVEHIVPRRDGGTDALINLIPACAECNYAGGSHAPEIRFHSERALTGTSLEIVRRLDALGVRRDAGARIAARELAKDGARYPKAHLQHACRWRRLLAAAPEFRW